MYWTISKIIFLNLFTCKGTYMIDWVGRFFVHGFSKVHGFSGFYCFFDNQCGIIETQELFPRTYFTRENHIGCWNIQENLESVLNWAGVLLCFLKTILGNRYVLTRGFIVSKPRETHPRSEIADVPASPCPPLDNLGCPDPHPPP